MNSGWDVNTWTAIGGRMAAIVLLAIVGLIVVHLASRRLTRLAQSSTEGKEGRQKQLGTLIQVVRWIVQVTIVGAALLTVLGHFIDITPVLASAGVVGLAVSLGAQTLIKDFIGGFLILIENQYAVGDVIQVGGVSGSVERLTLRTTHVRDVNGNLHVVPNGDVRTVANVTRGWSRAMVDIGVAYEEDLERVVAVLEGVVDAFVDDSDFGPQLLERPKVLAPLSLGDWSMTMRVMVKTPAGKQWGVAMELRKRILAACKRAKVELPYPRQEVLVRSLDQPNQEGPGS
jgi:small-conductance mechanosensitive channel